jgi:hypothetical protein
MYIEDLIPVTERMPERRANVIVYIETTNTAHIGYYVDPNDFSNMWFNSSGFRLNNTVTHWMELPLGLKIKIAGII